MNIIKLQRQSEKGKTRALKKEIRKINRRIKSAIRMGGYGVALETLSDEVAEYYKSKGFYIINPSRQIANFFSYYYYITQNWEGN